MEEAIGGGVMKQAMGEEKQSPGRHVGLGSHATWK